MLVPPGRPLVREAFGPRRGPEGVHRDEDRGRGAVYRDHHLLADDGDDGFDGISEAAQAGFIGGSLFTAAVVLVFIGAIGKSAQFPLHVWLPDAMEGPTPV